MANEFIDNIYDKLQGGIAPSGKLSDVGPASSGSRSSPVSDFVEKYAPVAERVAARTGNDPSLYLAQWGLETGWGKSIIPGTNNLGNIKDFSGSGVSAKDNLTKTIDKYRAYDTPDDFADDFTGLLGRRYKSALNVGNDPLAFASALKKNGYAEANNYVDSVVNAHKMVSERYDGSGKYGLGNKDGVVSGTPEKKQDWRDLDGASALIAMGNESAEPVVGGGYAGEKAEPKKTFGFGKEIGAAIDSYQANLWAIPAAMGSEYALKQMLDNKSEAEKQWAASGAPQSFDEMEFGKNFGEYFAHMALQSAPYMAEFVATGFGVGSLAKGAIAQSAKGVAEKAIVEATKRGLTKEAATKVGEEAASQFVGKIYTAAGVAGSYPSAVGDVLSNQYEQSQKFDPATAAALGVPYAALNAAGTEGMLTRGIARGLPKTSLTKQGVAGFAGRAALTGAEAGLMEGSTEAGQEVLNQAGRMAVDPNATLTSGDAPERYKESFIAGAMLGGIPGAVAGGFRKPEAEKVKDSPLTTAANAAANAVPDAQVQNQTAIDPLAETLKPIADRFNDRSFFASVRDNPNLGPDAWSDILASYRVATNTNNDPQQRQDAINRLSGFFSAFDGTPNFTMGSNSGQSGFGGLPVVAGGQGVGAVGFVDPSIGAIDGESQRVSQMSQQGRISQQVPALATDERAKQQAQAEYDAAYQDLVKAEQLGASDQVLMQKQIAMRDAEYRLQEISRAIEENRKIETAKKRDELLGSTLENIQPGQNPLRAFDRALKQAGFSDTTFTDAEKSKIAQWQSLNQTLAQETAQEEAQQAAPVAPNELDASALGIKERKPAAEQQTPSGRKLKLVDDLMAAGYIRKGDKLVDPVTKNVVQLAPAQIARAKRNEEKARESAQSIERSGEGESGNAIGSNGNDGVVPEALQGQANVGASTDVATGQTGSVVQPPESVPDDGLADSNVTGESNAAEPEQVAEETPQTNDEEAQSEQGSTSQVTAPSKNPRLMFNADGEVVEVEALHDLTFDSLPGILFFTRTQADGKFGIVEDRTGLGVFSGADTEQGAIEGFSVFVERAGSGVVAGKISAKPSIESNNEAQSAVDPWEIPEGWSGLEYGILTNKDPVTGGIVDQEMVSKKWFAISNQDGIDALEGFDTRIEAIRALDNAVSNIKSSEKSEIAERIEKAEEKTNTNPTDAQKESGNYAKGKFAWRGMTIAIETPKGAERSGIGEDGEPWNITAPVSYGYFLGTVAADKEHLDVYIGPNPESDSVFVVNQTKVDSSKFDEHKVMIGFDSAEDAKKSYEDSFSDGFAPRVFGSISGPFSVDEFKSQIKSLEKPSPLNDRLIDKSDRLKNEDDISELAVIDSQLSIAKQLLSCVLGA